MPRYLAIDWNPPHLRVLAARTAKGKATAEQSLSLELPNELTAPTAATHGRHLKEALAQANVAAAPVLFSIPRDQVIFKEIAIPFVPPHEEATVVRFQAAKEMSEAPSEVVLDYCLFAPPKAGQQSRVQVVIVRKSIVTALTALCQSAGLKLAAIVPRPFALAGLLDRKSPATVSLARGLLVAKNETEADFCVYVADRLEWARSVAIGDGLAAEVQRNLMLLAAQKSLPEIAKVEVAGALAKLDVPTEPLDPWRDGDAKPKDPLPFLAPLGLGEAMALGLPLNLADPKQPKPMVDQNARLKRLGAIAAIALVPFFVFICWWTLSQTRADIAELEETKADLENKWKLGEQDRVDVVGLKEWEDTTIDWLDELYDVAARLPHGPKAQGLRITQFAAAPKIRRGAGVKDAFTGTFTLHGAMSHEQDVLVQQFLDPVRGDPHLKAQTPTFKVNEFVVKIDAMPQAPAKYATKLVVPPDGAMPQPKKVPEPPSEPVAPTPDKALDKTPAEKTDKTEKAAKPEGKSNE